MHCLVFDFDGTLAEVNIDFAAMKRQVVALAREMGLSSAWPGEGYLLEQVEAAGRLLGPGFAARAMELILAVEWEAAGRARLFEFTPGLLRRAAGLGLKTAVISRNSEAAIRRVFPAIDEMASLFLPREAVAKTKPHPEHVWRALEELGVSAQTAVMVGDHPTDMQAGRAAGCFCAGVLSGNSDRESLLAAGAGIILPHAGGLLGALGLEPAQPRQ